MEVIITELLCMEWIHELSVLYSISNLVVLNLSSETLENPMERV